MKNNHVIRFKDIALSALIGLAALSAPAPAWAAPKAPAAAQSVRSVTQTGWSDLDDALPRDGTLIEGSYLGEGQRTGRDYRLHLLQYQELDDTFLALLESEGLDMAVIGFVKREPDGNYLWRLISADRNLEQLRPRPTRDPMYRISLKNDRKGYPVAIELTGMDPAAGTEVVRFTEAREALMLRQPVAGDYSTLDRGDAASWKVEIRKDSDPKNAIWHLDQVTSESGSGGSRAEKDLARADIPGVLSAREATYNGYVPQPSPTIKWAIVSLERAVRRKTYNQLIVFAFEPAGAEFGGEYVLTRPKLGYRLNLMK